MKRNNNTKVTYDQDADVLAIEEKGGVIDYAREMGDVIVHFTKRDEPVLIEILNASKTMGVKKARSGLSLQLTTPAV